MATIIAKNNTASEIRLNDLGGKRIPVSGEVTLTDTLPKYEIYESADLDTEITAGNVILNDGSTDLSATTAVEMTEPFNPQTTLIYPVDITVEMDYVDLHDWNPTGLSNCSRVIVNCIDDSGFTGITAPAAGINQTLTIVNIGPHTLWLIHNDSASVAANRIVGRNAKHTKLQNGGGVTLTYIHSESRWFVLTWKE